MSAYYVEGPQWFVVATRTKREARRVGLEEFGRGGVLEVRRATEKEVASYIAIKGADALEP